MAYKSKSKNTSRSTRVTRTINTNGPSTYTTSTSLSGGNRKSLVSTRVSQTTKSKREVLYYTNYKRWKRIHFS